MQQTGATAGAVERHCGRIVRCSALTRDIQEIVLAVNGSCCQRAKAGQYADLSVAGIAPPRSYSFARPPQLEITGEVRFFIRHVPGGCFTDGLFAEDRCGAEVEVAGPFGNFYRRESNGAMICVAGGSGLAPIKALLEESVEQGVACDLVVYFGARTQQNLYCLAELRDLCQRWRGAFQLNLVLSEEPCGSDWTGPRGLVTDALEMPAVHGTLQEPP